MRGLVEDWGRTSPIELECKEDGTYEALMASKESVERLLGLNYGEIEGNEHVLLKKGSPCNFQ